MKLAGSTVIHASEPLDTALRRLNSLGFRFVDLGSFDWAHLDAEAAVGDEAALGEEIDVLIALESGIMLS